jgi:membrane associated rhomboid family serine protease
MIPLFDDAGVVRRSKDMLTLLIVLNVCAFGYENLLGPDVKYLIYDYGLIPYHITHNVTGQSPVYPPWLTLFSSMFIHGGWLHIGGNMLYLWVFGDEIEGELGSFGFLFFYLAGGCLAGLVQAFMFPSSSIPVIGASGAIAAVLGAYIASFPRARVMTLVGFFFLNLPAWVVLGVWALMQWFQGVAAINGAGGSGSDVAVWAHVGGFVFGVVVIMIFRISTESPRLDQPAPIYPFYSQRKPW